MVKQQVINNMYVRYIPPCIDGTYIQFERTKHGVKMIYTYHEYAMPFILSQVKVNAIFKVKLKR